MIDTTKNNDLKNSHNRWIIRSPFKNSLSCAAFLLSFYLRAYYQKWISFRIIDGCIRKILSLSHSWIRYCRVRATMVTVALNDAPPQRIFLVFSLYLIFLTTFWRWEVWIIAGAGMALFRYRHHSMLEIKLALISVLALIIIFAFIWNVNTLLALNVQSETIYNQYCGSLILVFTVSLWEERYQQKGFSPHKRPDALCIIRKCIFYSSVRDYDNAFTLCAGWREKGDIVPGTTMCRVYDSVYLFLFISYVRSLFYSKLYAHGLPRNAYISIVASYRTGICCYQARYCQR